jgi:hypothetical protein
LIVLWAGVAAALAVAPEVYVNGVRADGLRDFTFTRVDVRVDAAGNIWIDAPQYKVEAADAPPAAVVPGRYWLLVEDVGSVGFLVEVVVNGQLVSRVRSGASHAPIDLAPHLRPGENTVLLQSVASSSDTMGRLVVRVGTGSRGANLVSLDATPAAELERAGPGPDRGVRRVFRLDVR